MHIVGCRENGLAYQSLVNEISAEELRTPGNKSKLMPDPRVPPPDTIETVNPNTHVPPDSVQSGFCRLSNSRDQSP